MKLKTIVIAILLVTSSMLSHQLWAQSYNEPVLTGKPYEAPRSFDLSLPEIGDVSQMVLTTLDDRSIGEQILSDVSTRDAVGQD